VIEHAAELITYDRHFTTIHKIRIWDHLGRHTA